MPIFGFRQYVWDKWEKAQKHIPYPTLVEKPDRSPSGRSRASTIAPTQASEHRHAPGATEDGAHRHETTPPPVPKRPPGFEVTKHSASQDSPEAPPPSLPERTLSFGVTRNGVTEQFLPLLPVRPSETLIPVPERHVHAPPDNAQTAAQGENATPQTAHEIQPSESMAVQSQHVAPHDKFAAEHQAAATQDQATIDPFQPVATNAPPTQIPSRSDHPVPRLNIGPQSAPLQTNKFYANFYLGGQNNAAFLHPYSVAWSKGSGPAKSWGLAVSHIEASQRSFGPTNTKIPGSPASFYINPLGIQSLVLSAAELGHDTTLTTDSLTPYSVNVNLLPKSGSPSRIKFPLCQGIGFVTAIYTNLEPVINTGVFFRQIKFGGSPRAGVYKFQLTLEDDKQWLLYVTPDNKQQPAFTLESNKVLKGPNGPWSGVIQVAKNPVGAMGESVYDATAGMYATTASMSGSVSGSQGKYTITWIKAGSLAPTSLLMFALPHHLATFDGATAHGVTQIVLDTTTKGRATAVSADSWTMLEKNLPTSLSFGPWDPASDGKGVAGPAPGAKAVLAASHTELAQAFDPSVNVDSMYYAGKALSKFATLVWAIQHIGGSPDTASQGLERVKNSFALFTQNKQQFPLVYDAAWKGIVSSATYKKGDVGADFGNSLYNDHHFHYGYFIHAAAVVGSMDSGWLAENKDWVNALVRDVANPSGRDGYFPVFRSFDWYHGHSWAKGLYDSGDSKDQESTTEDAMAAYAIKLWGSVIGDRSMEARGTLMLAVLARTINTYFFMTSDNAVQPAPFIGNKVTGILFENKVDYTTYFGNAPEYIHGIHMIPLMPFSPLIRPKRFVQEEWDAFFKAGAVADAANVKGGWQGLLLANRALIAPKEAFDFFNKSSFDPGSLDGGATRTWYLALAAAYGGDAS